MDELTDRIWRALKSEAADWARRNRPLPVDGEAERAVKAAARRERGHLPSNAVEFYAAEFRAMVAPRKKDPG